MTLTKSLTRIALSGVMIGVTGGIIAVSAETAAAAGLKYNVTADVFKRDFGAGTTDIGDVTGSFFYDGTSFSNISLTTVIGSFSQTFNLFLEGGDQNLVANNALLESIFPGQAVAGIDLFFPKLTGFTPGQTELLFTGSTTINGGLDYSAVGGSITAVPTPALLPGLIGLGVAALRRKNEESAEENA